MKAFPDDLDGLKKPAMHALYSLDDPITKLQYPLLYNNLRPSSFVSLLLAYSIIIAGTTIKGDEKLIKDSK